MKTLFRILLALALAVSFTAWAGETGSVSGTVKDGTGAGVPGATVKVSGPQMPAGRTVVTTSGGAYNFQRLLPGNYTVEASLQGLGKASKKVAVTVDNDVQVELTLIQTATGEVVVTASLAEVDKKSTEVSANFVSAEVRQLPLPRTYEGLLNLIPGAPATDGNGYVAVGGGTRQDNKYLVDGVNITNPGYGYLGIDTNELDIADVNVKRAGITAEFGRTSGAVVNAVTKSGTNDLKGDLRIVVDPKSFNANYKETITREGDTYNAALGLGFPIMKDILFGYVSGRYSWTKTSGQSATIGGVTTTQPDTKTTNQDYFGKVTAFLGQSVLLNAGFRALPNKTTDGFDSAYDAASAAWGSDNTNYVANFTADWFASKNTILEGKYIYYEENNGYGAQNVLTSRPMTIDPNHPELYGAYADPARNFGNTGVYYVTNANEPYKRNEVRLTASQFLDLGPTQNQFKIGGGAEFTNYNFIRTSNGWGSLIKDSTCPKGICGPTAMPGEVRARFYNLQPEQDGRARTYSAFLQDTLTWNRLSATLGILFNYDDFAQICTAGTAGCPTRTGESESRYNFMTFRWGDEVQPRLGLVYNTELLKGDKVYTNYGEYAGLDQKSTMRSFAPYRNREDQAWFDKTTGQYLGQQIRGSSTGKYIPPDLKAPYQQEWIIGYSAPVLQDIAFDVFYQYRNLKDPFEDAPGDPNNYNINFQAKTFFNARRVYRGVTLDVTKRYSHGWYANVNYTYSKLYGNWDEDQAAGSFNTSSYLEDGPGDNSAEPNRYGRLTQDRPHILKIMGSYDIFGFTLGGFLRVQSGTPWEARGNDAASSSYYRYLEPAGTRRLATWTNFDLLAAYNFNLGSGLNLRLEGRIQNLFNTQTALMVNRTEYLDPYVDGTPPSTLGPQGTKQPNSLFGTPTSWATPRRFVLTALLNF